MKSSSKPFVIKEQFILSVLSANTKENVSCMFVCFVIGILKGQFSLTYVGWLAKQSGSLYKSGSWVDHTVKTKESDWKQMWHFKSFHCKKQKRDKDGAGRHGWRTQHTSLNIPLLLLTESLLLPPFRIYRRRSFSLCTQEKTLVQELIALRYH